MVRIITDSAADFELDELTEKNIICTPMKISFGGEEYTENVNLTKTQFYEMLASSEEFPKTSQPAPYDFEKIFKESMDAGDEAVIITISSALSGTYQNAFLVKNMLEYDECYVVDGLSATAGQRILVEHAVKLRDEGKSAKDIAAEISELRGRVEIFACIDTLEYLYKGGRISHTSYTVGSFVNIKPMITVSREGRVEVAAKALSMRKGIKNICARLEKVKPDMSYPMYLVYSHNRKNAELLAEAMGSAGCDVQDSQLVNIGATIGAHIGQNACGVIYISEK